MQKFFLDDEKPKFSSRNKFAKMGLTFDDMKLVYDQNATVKSADIDVSTVLTPTLKLKLPLISAAMDTVTEARFATELAKLGGLGVIHKNMTIAEQADEVKRVKTATFDSDIYPNAATDNQGRLLVAGAVGEDPVNIPGTSYQYKNWRRKLSATLESMFADDGVNKLLKDLDRRRRAAAKKT